MGMEYEIQNQGEDVLFDDSTNPSLKPDQAEPVTKKPPRGTQADHADKGKLQSAEVIPEEEHQLA